MFVLLFLLWLVLNGGWSLQIAGAGALAAGLVAWGCQWALGLPFWGGRKLWQGILRAVGYLPLLLRAVWTANLQVILRILCPGRRRGAPRLSWMDPGPVSYTHLDVYKRQDGCAAWNGDRADRACDLVRAAARWRCEGFTCGNRRKKRGRCWRT